MKYSRGYKFKVCSFEKLKKDGWTLNISGDSYSHSRDYALCVILTSMINQCVGQTLTVKYQTAKNWYIVEENSWEWPVGTFLTGREIPETDHECEEGMTELGGWFICKHCGTNLRKIK